MNNRNSLVCGFLTAVFCLSVTGCSWVKLTSEGSNVALLQASEVSQCDYLGDISVSVLSKVGVERSSSKVEQELHTLARNTAAERGGDAIVAVSDVSEGRRDYDLYKCRP